MQPLSKEQGEVIGGLINSLTIWTLAVEKPNNTDEQTIQYMKWHNQYADKLAEHGIRVARYNLPENLKECA
jgi:hypothetical protein